MINVQKGVNCDIISTVDSDCTTFIYTDCSHICEVVGFDAYSCSLAKC